MRIGILTFHRAYNYGAFLQCFSLVSFLKKKFPEHQIEVIDYASKNMMDYYKTDIRTLVFGGFSRKTHMGLRYRLGKVKRFIKKIKNNPRYVKHLKERNSLFIDSLKELPLSKNSLISDDEQKFNEFINSCDYDIIIVGSDAVWNDYQTTIPNLYYLNSKIGAKRVSYAASVFGMNFKRKTNSEIHEISEKLKLFEFIGVRDSATEQYINSMNNNLEVYHTCDPSILLDLNMSVFDKNSLRKKLEEKGLDFSKPIYGIMGGDWLGKIARELIGSEAQLVAVYEDNSYADIYLNDLSPWEWAIVFSNFELTFTHFFHGTLFSIKNGTPTLSIEIENEYSKNFDTKILDVLKRLDLTDYRFTKEQAEHSFGKIKSQFDYVTNHLEEEKERIAKALKIEVRTHESFVDCVSDVVKGN